MQKRIFESCKFDLKSFCLKLTAFVLLFGLCFGLFFAASEVVKAQDNEGEICCKNNDCGSLSCKCASDNCVLEMAAGEKTVKQGRAGFCMPSERRVICPVITVFGVIENFLNWVFVPGIAVCSLMLVVVGFFYVTSRGTLGQTTLARKMLKWTLIALGAVILSKVIFNLLMSIFVPYY